MSRASKSRSDFTWYLDGQTAASAVSDASKLRDEEAVCFAHDDVQAPSVYIKTEECRWPGFDKTLVATGDERSRI